MKFGYACISTPIRNLDRQIVALRSKGCAQVFRDKTSGKWLKARPYLDLTTPIRKGVLTFMSALADDERAGIASRAKDGRKIAREKDVCFGRKPKFTDHQKDKARQRLAAGESTREIAKDFGVSHPMISRLNN